MLSTSTDTAVTSRAASHAPQARDTKPAVKGFSSLIDDSSATKPEPPRARSARDSDAPRPAGDTPPSKDKQGQDDQAQTGDASPAAPDASAAEGVRTKAPKPSSDATLAKAKAETVATAETDPASAVPAATVGTDTVTPPAPVDPTIVAVPVVVAPPIAPQTPAVAPAPLAIAAAGIAAAKAASATPSETKVPPEPTAATAADASETDAASASEATATAPALVPAANGKAKPIKAGEAPIIELGDAQTREAKLDAPKPENAKTAAAPGVTPAPAKADPTAVETADGKPKEAAATGHPKAAATAIVTHDGLETVTNAETQITAVVSAAVSQTTSNAPPATASLTATVSPAAPVPLNGLAVELATRAQSGATRFDIRLDPAELGRIDVRIDIDKQGQVTSHLTVEKPETLAMLRQDSPQLQRALTDAGLKTSDNGLQFSLGDQSQSRNNPQADSGERQMQRFIVRDDDTLTASAAPVRGYGRMLAARSGIDISV